MNKSLYSIIQKHHLHPIGYRKIGKVLIIEDKLHQYALKPNTSNYDIYRYLISRDFEYFPENFNTDNDNYDLSLYMDNTIVSKNQKLNDYVELLSLLHHKTAYEREVNLDDIKEVYDNLEKQIIYIHEYYERVNDLIDQEVFLSPSKYLLVRHLSLFYYLLSYAKEELQTWYVKIQNEKKKELALIHNNIDLSHLIINEDRYLISWDKACFDSPINDLIVFYQKYYQDISLSMLLDKYQSIHKLKPLDLKLLLIKLAIPKKIDLSNSTYDDTIEINHEIHFLQRVYDYLLAHKVLAKNTIST